MSRHEPSRLVLGDGGTVAARDLSPRALAVLRAYAMHGPADMAPTSRRLRADYAPTLSRAQWARGVRELLAAGYLDPRPEGVRVALPADLVGRVHG